MRSIAASCTDAAQAARRIAAGLILVGAFINSCFAGDLLDRRASANPEDFWQHGSLVYHALTAFSVGGALWLGTEDRLGRTLWQSTEAFAATAVTAELLKHASGRRRPNETDDPDQWGEGGRSFPSRHVAATTAMVTPLILEYAAEYPAAWALAAIPVYEMISRVKMRKHWQTDVLAGAALGAAIGYAGHRNGPFVIRVLPDGVFLGWRKSLR